MKQETPDIKDALAICPRYPLAAFEFIANTVQFAIEELPERRHLSAKELCEAAKRFAQLQYGMVADLVLNEWNLTTSEAAGEIVYALIRCRVLSASEDDDPKQFEIGYSLLSNRDASKKKIGKLPQIDLY